MEQQKWDLVIGLHSIVEAINNPKRTNQELFLTKDALANFKGKISNSKLEGIKKRFLDPHKLQEEGKRYFEILGYTYQRITSQMFLLTDPLEIKGVAWLYEEVEKGTDLKLFCLDQVTDVHNAGAILRTCAFYGVDALILSNKGNFGLSPAFYRTASGSVEHVPVVQCTQLPRMLTKLQELGVTCIGFSEHEKNQNISENLEKLNRVCLIVGAEDRGISHAALRVLQNTVAIKSNGEISSLNVSVASAVAMDRFYQGIDKS